MVRHLLCYKKRQGGRQNASPTKYCAVYMRFARSVRIRSRQNAEIQTRREGRGFAAASLLNRIRAKQKRKPDNVLRSISIRVSLVPCETVTVKTRRRVADCPRIRKVPRRDFTLQGHPQKCPQEIFGEEEKPQGGLGGQASLVCLPASARFDEVRAQDAPLYAFRSPEQKSYR